MALDPAPQVTAIRQLLAQFTADVNVQLEDLDTRTWEFIAEMAALRATYEGEPPPTPDPRVITVDATAGYDGNGGRVDFTLTLASGTAPTQVRWRRDGADGGWTSPWYPWPVTAGDVTYLPWSTLVTITVEDGEGGEWTDTATTPAAPTSGGGGPLPDPEPQPDAVVQVRNALFVKPGGDGPEGAAFLDAYEAEFRTFAGLQLNTSTVNGISETASVTIGDNIFGLGYMYILSSWLWEYASVPADWDFDLLVAYAHEAGCDDFIWNIGNEANFHAGELDNPTAWAARFNAYVTSMRAAQTRLLGTSPCRIGVAFGDMHSSYQTEAEIAALVPLLNADWVGFNNYDKLSAGAAARVLDANGSYTWADPAAVWAASNQPSFDFFSDVAYDNGLDFAMAEWGLWFGPTASDDRWGGNDNAYFVQANHDALVAIETRLATIGKHVIGHSLFAQDGADVPHDVRNGPFAWDKFVELYGGTAPPPPPPPPSGNVTTSDPNPTANAQAVLEALDALGDTTSVISGQQAIVRGFDLGTSEFTTIANASSGARPGVAGVDYFHWTENGSGYQFDYQTSNAFAKAHWAAGGLVKMTMHCYNFMTGQSGNTNPAAFPSNTQIGQSVIDGTAENIALKAMFDRVITGLLDLQNSGVVVLFAPWHEWNFYWSTVNNGITSANLKALWQFTHDYFISQGVHNVLWTYAPKADAADTSIMTDKYPGDAYVDVIAFSVYDPVAAGTTLGHYTAAAATGKPVGLAEFGPGLDPITTGYSMVNGILSAITTHNPRICFIMNWWSGHGIQNTASNGTPYMTDAKVLNRGEINWQAYL
jgi:hypothetical protein